MWTAMLRFAHAHTAHAEVLGQTFDLGPKESPISDEARMRELVTKSRRHAPKSSGRKTRALRTVSSA